MRYQTNLVRHGSIYYCRMRIPADLIPHFEGRPELRVSLNTPDRAVAISLTRRLTLEWLSLFEQVREQLGIQGAGL